MPRRNQDVPATAHRARQTREPDLHGLASALASGDCGDPFSILGLHAENPDRLVVRCYHPGASRAWHSSVMP